MNYIFKLGIYCILFLYSVNNVYSFQNSNISASSLQKKLFTEKQKADILMNEGSWDEAILEYKKVQQKYIDLDLKSVAIDLYEDILIGIAIREDLELLDKRVAIENIHSTELDPRFEGLYYGALAHLFAFYGEMDSVDFYYNKACLFYQKDKRFLLEGKLNTTLAFEFYMLDNLQSAQVFLNTAENILKTKLNPSSIDLPTIYNVQTLIYAHLGEYEKALRSNLISIKTLESDDITSPLDLAYEYNNW